MGNIEKDFGDEVTCHLRISVENEYVSLVPGIINFYVQLANWNSAVYLDYVCIFITHP
jgi:hypothetical protein